MRTPTRRNLERRHNAILRRHEFPSATRFFGGFAMKVGPGMLVSLLIALAICGFCFDYGLDVYFGKDIPWYGDCLAGLFTSPVTVPAAVVGYVLVECDVPTPVFFPPEAKAGG